MRLFRRPRSRPSRGSIADGALLGSMKRVRGDFNTSITTCPAVIVPVICVALLALLSNTSSGARGGLSFLMTTVFAFAPPHRDNYNGNLRTPTIFREELNKAEKFYSSKSTPETLGRQAILQQTQLKLTKKRALYFNTPLRRIFGTDKAIEMKKEEVGHEGGENKAKDSYGHGNGNRSELMSKFSSLSSLSPKESLQLRIAHGADMQPLKQAKNLNSNITSKADNGGMGDVTYFTSSLPSSSESMRQQILTGAMMKLQEKKQSALDTRNQTPISKNATLETIKEQEAIGNSDNDRKSIRKHILHGAALKLQRNKSRQSNKYSKESNKLENVANSDGKYRYYIREGLNSEIDAIANILMEAFHGHKKTTFDSYIRRYKYNHLKMCFDVIDERDRGLFVACAIPASDAHDSKDEQIVGFCYVDGRPPDPQSRIEFLTPSTLASSSPRPYLSDLGVAPEHRRCGIGQDLVQACEEWTRRRGYEKLYLKVEKSNLAGKRLYLGMGYKMTSLPWMGKGRTISNAGTAAKFDKTILLEKSFSDDSLEPKSEKKKQRWRSHLVQRIWRHSRGASSRLKSGPHL